MNICKCHTCLQHVKKSQKRLLKQHNWTAFSDVNRVLKWIQANWAKKISSTFCHFLRHVQNNQISVALQILTFSSSLHICRFGASLLMFPCEIVCSTFDELYKLYAIITIINFTKYTSTSEAFPFEIQLSFYCNFNGNLIQFKLIFQPILLAVFLLFFQKLYPLAFIPRIMTTKFVWFEQNTIQ